MSSGSPTREQADLAEVLEMVLDKGIVINADIAVTVGQTELLGIEIRAAIASFETAAKYGLAFPSGTDMQRVEQASGRQSLEGEGVEPIDLGIDASSDGSAAEDDADDGDEAADADEGSGGPSSAAPGSRPTPTVMTGGESDEGDGGSGEGAGDDEETADDADSGSSEDETADESTDDADATDADGGDA